MVRMVKKEMRGKRRGDNCVEQKIFIRFGSNINFWNLGLE
jgi:hypothetical protein